MTTSQVARKIVELVHQRAWREAIDTLYADDVVSVEARGRDGQSAEKRGIEAVRAKTDWWVENVEVHRFEATELFVAHDHFVVIYEMDFVDKTPPGRHIQMSEAGIYTVKDGKIVREEFLLPVEVEVESGKS